MLGSRDATLARRPGGYPVLDHSDLIESPDPAARRRLMVVGVRWGKSTAAIWRIAQALADARASARRELTLPLHALPVEVQDAFLALAARAREHALQLPGEGR
jgi:hypothetical protein